MLKEKSPKIMGCIFNVLIDKVDINCTLKGEKGAGMTGVSKGIEYPLLHEILHTVSET